MTEVNAGVLKCVRYFSELQPWNDGGGKEDEVSEMIYEGFCYKSNHKFVVVEINGELEIVIGPSPGKEYNHMRIVEIQTLSEVGIVEIKGMSGDYGNYDPRILGETERTDLRKAFNADELSMDWRAVIRR